MPADSPRDAWIDLLWTLIAGVLSSAAIVSSSSQLSGTFDERFYLESGLTRWRTGSTYELMRAGKPLEAAIAFQEALKANAKDIRSLLGIGGALRAQGKSEEAAGLLRQALDRNPELAQVRLDLGAALKEGGRVESGGSQGRGGGDKVA